MLALVIMLTAFASWVILAGEINLPFIGERPGMRLGLDLQGGTYLIYEADLSQIKPGEADEAIKGAMEVIQKRIDAFGITEPLIQRQGESRIVVQLPGLREVEEAKEVIGRTAILEFREQAATGKGGNTILRVVVKRGNDQFSAQDITGFEVGDICAIGPLGAEEFRKITAIDEVNNILTVDSAFVDNHNAGEAVIEWIPATGTIHGEEIWLTTSYLEGDTHVVLDRYTNAPLVTLKWNDKGQELFFQITSRLVGKPLGIFLGDQPLLGENGHPITPIVMGPLRESAQIQGLSLDDARMLSTLLNAGRMPVPLSLVKEQTVDATLGADSLEKSITAGGIGLGLVLFFMLIYYRLPGAVACIALLIYAVLVLAVFKLIPVTLTLGGLAAFTLSIGMAVDANILIFERMKEEIRSGKSLGAAIEAGFSRAWPSIRDSNVSTFITCGILVWFGNMLAEPRIVGFALTLFIGVGISMFSAIFVTRTFLRLLIGTRLAQRMSLFRI